MLPITNQSACQLEMRNTLSDLLVTDVINIVDLYFAFADAAEVLTLGPDHEPLDSETNRTIIEAIKQALSSPTCDRDMIRLIFKNASDHSYTHCLNNVMNDLRSQKKPIILNDVDFSGINLAGLNFDSASITKANFTGACLEKASFPNANLRGAQGLASASGVITVNFNSKLADTGFPFESAYLFLLVGDKSFWIALDSRNIFDLFSIESCGTTLWINFKDTLS